MMMSGVGVSQDGCGHCGVSVSRDGCDVDVISHDDGWCNCNT